MNTQKRIAQKSVTTVTPLTIQFKVQGDELKIPIFLYVTELEQADHVRKNEILISLGGSAFTYSV